MCEEVGGCSSEGEARLARSRQLALGVSSSGTEGAHPALVPLRGLAPELAVRLRAARREACLLGEARVAVADQGVLGRLGDRAAARLVGVRVGLG